jgi:hypothetical protein
MTTMPHSRKWQQSLSIMHGSVKASLLISQAQGYYDRFSAQHSAEQDRANRAVLRTRILPGLSIYKALLDQNTDREEVLAEMDILFRAAFFTITMRGLGVLRYLPDPFFVIRPTLKLMTRKAYLPGSQEIVEDSADCFALNVYRCYILDVLATHDARELTASYCKTDDWLTEALPQISWERTKTLGRGDACCDFRWCRTR